MKKVGNWIGVFLLLSLLLAGQPSAPAHASVTIRHVTPSGLNSGSCSTWATACNFLHALGFAIPGDQLWVTQGTYKPGSLQTSTFTLKNGVKIFGGFAGTETSLNQRNYTTHVTVLSGDIGVSGNTSDNIYHVLTGGSTNSTAVLDGFTVTSGDAYSYTPASNSYGGGMYNTSGSSPTLVNLIFSSNSAASDGGGMSNTSGSSPSLMNVTFINNTAPSSYGGGMYNQGSNPKLTNVTFKGNSAHFAGGGIYNDTSSPPLLNVTFEGNSANFGGGMFNYMLGSNPALKNVTFHGNSAQYGGGISDNTSSDPTLTNVTFSGNSASVSGGAIYSTFSSAAINDSIFWNDGTELGRVSSTITITDSIIQGGALGSCYSGVTCTNVLGANPLLGPLVNNGGYTKTMALKAGSAAIDAGGLNSTCASRDQRGVKRPQGPHCDIGAYEAPVTKTFSSIASQDGWILESGENTNVGGGSPNSAGPTLTLGDNASRKQYRAVISFSISSLPDNAIIASILLKLKRSSVTPPATNPISLLQGIMLDMKKGFFGSSSSLQASDFQASASKTVGPYSPALTSGLYSINLPATMFTSINKLNTNGGLTQIRLRFKLDDNNNSIANTLNLISGNNATPANRPTLIIVYYTP